MDLPDVGRYRRRFIVEFGPEDSGLIDRMGVAHRTKRAAIIAGLRLLESGEVEQLQARVAELEQELASATAALATARAGSAKTAPELAKAKVDLKAEREAHGRAKRTLATMRKTLQKVEADLGRAEKAILALQAERDRLSPLLPHTAHCPSCDRLVPEAEWAEQATAEGIDVYHRQDGYRATDSLLRGRATVMLQRRTRPGASE